MKSQKYMRAWHMEPDNWSWPCQNTDHVLNYDNDVLKIYSSVLCAAWLPVSTKLGEIRHAYSVNLYLRSILCRFRRESFECKNTEHIMDDILFLFYKYVRASCMQRGVSLCVWGIWKPSLCAGSLSFSSFSSILSSPSFPQLEPLWWFPLCSSYLSLVSNSSI